MTPHPPSTIVILGAGPAGSALATWLARAGKRVVIFDPQKRPPLVVGESLIPATMPFLRDLGVVDEIASYSELKPGATFVLDQGRTVHSFRFDQVRGTKEPFAYNVPRDRYDATLLAAAQRAGATLVPVRAKVRREGDRVLLDPATVEAAGDALGGAQPDWVIDATGRSRTLAKLLDLPHEEGDRKDIALFAHMSGVPALDKGHVHTEVIDTGWAWRIPLPDRMSVGFVLDAQRAASFGSTDEERFDTLLATDSIASAWGGEPKRLTPVVRYQNYALTTLRGVGENWSLVGDAFGFIDPVFSSGMMLTLSSARELADALLSDQPDALARFEADQIRHMRGWRQAITTFYNGRLWAVIARGMAIKRRSIGRLIAVHFERQLPRVFTGEGTRSAYTLFLLRVLSSPLALIGARPSRYAVRR